MIKQFQLPKKGAFQIPTKDFFKLHTLLVAAGTRGSGKSVAIANLLKTARDRGYFDSIKLISPTYNSNKPIWDICNIEETDVIEPNKECIKQFIAFVEAEKKEWDDYIYKLEMYKNYIRDKHRNQYYIDDEDLLYYFENDFINGKKPEWKYHKANITDHPPRIALVIDDCLGTPIFANSSVGLINLCIKHRHVASGLGCSMFLLTQTYCSVGGMPRTIRENCQILLLFKNKDENQIKKVCSEIGTDISVDKFMDYFNYATKEPYNFLTIDFNPSSKDKTFQRNFTEYLS